MKRVLLLLSAGGLGACNVWGSGLPQGFDGWHHVDRPGRATSIAFLQPDVLDVHDLGCDASGVSRQRWVSEDGVGVVAIDSGGRPRFTVDPAGAGALVATPGMFSQQSEQWLPGATCLACPPGDAGVVVACDSPVLLDGGT